MARIGLAYFSLWSQDLYLITMLFMPLMTKFICNFLNYKMNTILLHMIPENIQWSTYKEMKAIFKYFAMCELELLWLWKKLLEYCLLVCGLRLGSNSDHACSSFNGWKCSWCPTNFRGAKKYSCEEAVGIFGVHHCHSVI